MRSLLAPVLVPESLTSQATPRSAGLRRRPFAARLRLGLQLVDRASAALPFSQAEARSLASAALVMGLPAAKEERSPAARPLLPIAADLAATAYCIEAESFLLEGRAARATAPAALARLLACHGSGDPLVFGAVEGMLGLRAWLHGNFGRSLRHLEAAIRDFAEAGDPRREAEAWSRTAVVLEQAGLVPEAQVASARARELVLRTRQPHLDRESEAWSFESSGEPERSHDAAGSIVNPSTVPGI